MNDDDDIRRLRGRAGGLPLAAPIAFALAGIVATCAAAQFGTHRTTMSSLSRQLTYTTGSRTVRPPITRASSACLKSTEWLATGSFSTPRCTKGKLTDARCEDG